MNSVPYILLITFSCTTNSQIYFPQDIPLEPRFEEITRNLSLLQRGTGDYQNYVENLIAKGVSKLTLSVDKIMSSSNSATLKNVVYSPVSIAGALALILLGSNGKTFDEVASVMGLAVGVDVHSKSQVVHEQLGRLLKKLDHMSDAGEQIKIATAIFVQNDFPIRTLYKDSSESIYNSEILNVDFLRDSVRAQSIINTWVSDRTNAKIKTMVSEPPPSTTKIIIASALYFKGAWEKPFFEGFTRRRNFFPNGRKTKSDVMVDMMSNGGAFPYFKDTTLDCEIMGFPYKGNQTTMYVVIPTRSNIERLKDLEKRLVPTDLERLVSNTKYTHSVVLFPKMKLESSLDLTQALQRLGVHSLFNPEESNLALLSPGLRSSSPSLNVHNANRQGVIGNSVVNPIAPSDSSRDLDTTLIFSRTAFPINCTQMFRPNSDMKECEEVDETSNKQVVYKKFGDKVGRRVTRQAVADTLDNLRGFLNRDPNIKNVENPGLYADKVLHKVYMDITESGTEAAAATSVSLSRGGDITTFRVDVPFLFFIRHEETKLILFWGSVSTPTPSFS